MSSFPPPREDPPAAILEAGRPRLGTYNQPIARINPQEVGQPGLRRRIRGLGIKEWEAFQLGDDQWFVLGAVYNAKALGLLQVLAVNKQHGTIQRWETKVAPWQLHVARGLSGTRSHGHHGGLAITIGNDLDIGRLTVDAAHPGNKSLAPLELHGVGDCEPSQAAHLAIVHPFDDHRCLYSHKTMMPFDGVLRIAGDDVGFKSDRGFLIVDDHHGEYPRPMRYDWLTGVRRSKSGEVQGFNLTDNQVRDPAVYNENAIWSGPELHRLPAIHIDRPKGPWGPWHAHDQSGAVDVRFTPTVRSTMHVGPRKSLAEYYAPYGWYEGSLEAEGFALDVNGFFGVGEQKLIRV